MAGLVIYKSSAAAVRLTEFGLTYSTCCKAVSNKIFVDEV